MTRGQDLDPFFTPRNLAIIGASANPQKLGYVLVDNLQRAGYRGSVYPVNPSRSRVLGLRCYPTVLEIEEPVDLALITVPAEAVTGVVEQCGRKGIRSAVVITAGFRETGPAGERAERELLKTAQRYGMRLVGPNSVGIINTAIGMNATFAETSAVPYGVSMFSQSGAVASAILDWARAVGLGFAKFVSLGNMADLSEVEVLDYFGNDDETKVIVGYLEGIHDGRRLMEVAKRVTGIKPLLLMKVGTTAAGARAAVSHTGALASAEAVVEGAFRQAGITRAQTMEELFDYVLCFSYAPAAQGMRVAVVTNAGGPGVMAADAIERNGLSLAILSSETAAALRRGLPAASALENPVDVLGDAGSDRYQAALEAVCADAGVDAVLVMLTPQRLTEPERTARVVSYLAREGGKPVLAVFMGGVAIARGRDLLEEARVPVYAYPERAVRALAALARYATYQQT